MSGEFKAVAWRGIDGSLVEVWEALVDVEVFKEWVGMNSQARVDLREGGDFHIDMQCGADKTLPHHGRFLKLSRPRLMEFTWISDFTNGESLVRIELKAVGGQTELTLTHSGLPDAANAADHEAGWTEMAGTLAARVVARAGAKG